MVCTNFGSAACPSNGEKILDVKFALALWRVLAGRMSSSVWAASSLGAVLWRHVCSSLPLGAVPRLALFSDIGLAHVRAPVQVWPACALQADRLDELARGGSDGPVWI